MNVRMALLVNSVRSHLPCMRIMNCLFIVLTVLPQAQLASAQQHEKVASEAEIVRSLDQALGLTASEPDRALRIADEIALRKDVPLPTVIRARLFEIRAKARLQLAELLLALDAADAALELFEEVGDIGAVSGVRLLRGEIYALAGDFRNASIDLEEALTLSTKAHDPEQMSKAHRLLGSMHYYQRQYQPAWIHYYTSLALGRTANDDAGLVRTYRCMGVLAAEDTRPDGLDRALAYTDTALQFAIRTNDRAEMSSIHGNLGLILMHMKDTALARIHNDSALFIARELGDSLRIMKAWENIGQLAGRYGDHERTCKNCAEVLAFAERRHMLAFARDAINCITTGYTNMGDWQQALGSQSRYYSLRDSTYDAASREQILKRSLEAEAARREHADALAHEAEVRRVETVAWSAGAGGLLLLSGGVAFALSDRKRRRERYERDAARLQTQVLRTQMNPHFIFNALNSINNYVQTNDRDLATGFLTKFAQLMRLVLESSRHAEGSLKNDLEALRLYMDLERARMQEKFDYIINVDPLIDQETTLVPPLVAQPFVENAIWHGVSGKEGKGHIVLKVEQRGSMLMMTIEDDGVGREPTAGVSPTTDQPPKTSLGTSITRDRLEMLGKQHGVDSGFHFTDLPQGTRVEVSMPLIGEG